MASPSGAAGPSSGLSAPSVGVPLEWTDTQTKWLKALNVVVSIQPHDKLHIPKEDPYNCEIDKRTWEAKRTWQAYERFKSEDGCQRTIDFVTTLMLECLDFSKRVHDNPRKVNAKTLQKCREMEQIYARAFQGMIHLRELYASPEEGEYKIANNLARTINVLSDSARPYMGVDTIPVQPIVSEDQASSSAVWTAAQGVYRAVAPMLNRTGHVAGTALSVATNPLVTEGLAIIRHNPRLPLNMLLALGRLSGYIR